jgi:hypothetical protein
VVQKGELFNTWFPLFRKGIGSLYCREGVNLFDQIVITPSLPGMTHAANREVSPGDGRSGILRQDMTMLASARIRRLGSLWKGRKNITYKIAEIFLIYNIDQKLAADTMQRVAMLINRFTYCQVTVAVAIFAMPLFNH